MAVLTTTLQLLFLGALISPVHLQAQDACELIKNSTNGNFSLSVNPAFYKASTNYSVTIGGAANSSVILQALNAQNSSVGEWSGTTSVNCSNSQLAQLNPSSSNTTVLWKSPVNGTAPVEIRVFVTLTNSSTQLRKITLNAESATTPQTTSSVTVTKITSTMTTSSVSTAQASSFLMAAIQLLSIFVTSKLFSC